MAMKISTKGRYALRLMLDLALHDTGAYIPLKEVAARQDISDKYLEQIITQLSRAGFVKSVRGAPGRLSSGRTSGQLYRRADPSPDGRLPVPGGMRGRGGGLSPGRPLRHHGGLARPEGGHRQRGGFHHSGRPRGKTRRTGRYRLLYLKKMMPAPLTTDENCDLIILIL